MGRIVKNSVGILLILLLLILHVRCGPDEYNLDTYAVAEELTLNSVTMRIEQVVYRPAFSVRRGFRDDQNNLQMQSLTRKEMVRVEGTISNHSDRWIHLYTSRWIAEQKYLPLVVFSVEGKHLEWPSLGIDQAEAEYPEYHFSEPGRDAFYEIPPGKSVLFEIGALGKPGEGDLVQLQIEKVGFADGATWSYDFEFLLPKAVEVEFDPFKIMW